VKPSFDKLLVCYGKDINLGVSEDGVLLPTIQPTMAQKGQYAKTKGILLVFINYAGKFKLVCCLFIYEYPNGPTGQTLFRTGDSGRNSLEKWLSAFI
jgi:hypothetical protein